MDRVKGSAEKSHQQRAWVLVGAGLLTGILVACGGGGEPDAKEANTNNNQDTEADTNNQASHCSLIAGEGWGSVPADLSSTSGFIADVLETTPESVMNGELGTVTCMPAISFGDFEKGAVVTVEDRLIECMAIDFRSDVVLEEIPNPTDTFDTFHVVCPKPVSVDA